MWAWDATICRVLHSACLRTTWTYGPSTTRSLTLHHFLLSAITRVTRELASKSKGVACRGVTGRVGMRSWSPVVCLRLRGALVQRWQRPGLGVPGRLELQRRWSATRSRRRRGWPRPWHDSPCRGRRGSAPARFPSPRSPQSAQVANVVPHRGAGFRYLSFARLQERLPHVLHEGAVPADVPAGVREDERPGLELHSPSWPSRSTAPRCRRSHVASCGERARTDPRRPCRASPCRSYR